MKKKILIIEDNNAIREVLSWILEEEGFVVIGAATGSTDPYIKSNADLILLDEWVNKREGHMLCEEIKKIHHLQHIPVITISTSPFIEEIAARCKADGFISMPFDLEEVISEARKCFSPAKEINVC